MAELNANGAVPAGTALRFLEYDLAIIRVLSREQQCSSLVPDVSDHAHGDLPQVTCDD